MTTNKPALIHFPFYCNQYLGIMSELTAKERGFWITLLATFVVSDGIFPANGRLYKRCDAIDESDRKIVDSLLPEIMVIGNEIISKQKLLSKKRSDAGRIGGKANAKQVLTKDKAKVEAKGKHTETETETELDKEKEKKPIKNNTKKILQKPDDVSLQVWENWKKHRKLKKAIITENVIDTFRKESVKAKMTLSDAINKSITRGWAGFEAKWLEEKSNRKQSLMQKANARETDKLLF